MTEMLGMIFSLIGAVPIVWGVFRFMRRGSPSNKLETFLPLKNDLSGEALVTIGQYEISRKMRIALTRLHIGNLDFSGVNGLRIEQWGPGSSGSYRVSLFRNWVELASKDLYLTIGSSQRLFSILIQESKNFEQNDDAAVNMDDASEEALPRIFGLLSKFTLEDGLPGLSEELNDYFELGYKKMSLLEISKSRFVLWQTVNLSISLGKGKLRSFVEKVATRRQASK